MFRTGELNFSTHINSPNTNGHTGLAFNNKLTHKTSKLRTQNHSSLINNTQLQISSKNCLHITAGSGVKKPLAAKQHRSKLQKKQKITV